MKFVVEIDLERGSGTVRWERITQRNIRRLMIGFMSIVTTVAALGAWLLHG